MYMLHILLIVLHLHKYSLADSARCNLHCFLSKEGCQMKLRPLRNFETDTS